MADPIPRVTVLMSVCNGQSHLREAIESILGQTFADFEFLVIDDGSTDECPAIIGSYLDPRLRVLRNEENKGLTASLRRGMELARGQYLARMDADDVSLPERLARQVAYLDRNPAVGVCGTWVRYIGASAKVIRYPESSAAIVAGLLFNPTLAHPAVMLRREVFVRNDLNYDLSCRRAQDYDLWIRAAFLMAFANIPEVLLNYRIHPAQVRSAQQVEQQDVAGRVRRSFLRTLGIEPTEAEFAMHQAIATCRFDGVGPDFFARADDWLCRLKAANDIRKRFAEPVFSHTLVEQWLLMGKKAFDRGLWSPRMIIHARLLSKTGLGWGFVAHSLMDYLRPGRREG